MDVGSARGKFVLHGLDTVIKELQKFREDLKGANEDYLHHRKEQAKVIEKYKEESEVIKAAVGRQKTYASAIRATGLALVNLQRRQAAVAAHIRKGIGIGTKPSVDQYFDRSAGVKAAEAYLKLRDAERAATRPLARLAAMTHKAGAAIKRMSGSVKTSYREFRAWLGVTDKAADRSNDWLHRFGLVAAGFAVAYRAINVVEFAVREITATLTSGLTALDNYRQGLATISGMLSLMSRGGGGFAKRFKYFHQVMSGSMREAMRTAPLYKLSINEISDAYKELAQFGVYVTQDMTKGALTAIAAIKEIATTSQSSSKQIRQEIQAVFNGSTRISDQFSIFLSHFPGLKDKLFGLQKSMYSNMEKWKLVLGYIANYYKVIIKANQSVTSQFAITKNTFTIISMRALEMSGVYKLWIDRLSTFNSTLIDSKGNLGTVGAAFLKTFSNAWYLVSKVAVLSLVMLEHWKGVVVQLKHMDIGFGRLAIHTFKTFASLKLIGMAINGFTGVGKFLLKELTNPITLFVVVLDIAKNLLFEFTNIDDTAFAKKLTSWTWWFNKIKNILSDAVIGWKTLLALAAHPSKFMGVISGAMDKFELKKAGFSPDKGRELFDKQLAEKAAKGLSQAQRNTYERQWNNYQASEKNRKFLLRVITGGLSPEEVQKELSARLARVGDATIKDFTDFYNRISKLLTGWSDKDLKFHFPDIDPKKFKGELATLKKELKGMKLGLEDRKATANFIDYSKNIKAATKNTEDFKVKSAEAYKMIGDKFGEYVNDTLTGKVKSLKDLFTGFLTFIRNSFAQTFADIANNMMRTFIRNKIGNTTMGGLLDMFGWAGSSAWSSASTTYAGTTGATAPSAAFSGLATGFASGGIIPEPVFGIGKSGKHYTFGENGPERVLSNKDSFASPNVTVNVINKSSQPVDAKIGDTRKLIKGMVTDVILEDRRRGGILSRG